MNEKQKLIEELSEILAMREVINAEEGLGTDSLFLSPLRSAQAQEVRERAIMLMQSLVGRRVMNISTKTAPSDKSVDTVKWLLSQSAELVPFSLGGMFGAGKNITRKLVHDVIDDLEGLKHGTAPDYLKPKKIPGSNRNKWKLLQLQRTAVGWTHFWHEYSGRKKTDDGWEEIRIDVGNYYGVSGQTIRNWEEEVAATFASVAIKFNNARRVARYISGEQGQFIPMFFRGKGPALLDYRFTPEVLITNDANDYRELKGISVLALPKSSG